MRVTHSYTFYTEQQHPPHYLTHDRPINRNIRKTPAHYYSDVYNTLPPALLQHVTGSAHPPLNRQKKPIFHATKRRVEGSPFPESGAGTSQCCPLTHTGST